MAISTVVARRYAAAYFSLARDAGKIADWRRDLAEAVAVATDLKVAAALRNPRIPREQRMHSLLSLLEDVASPARNLMRLLFERGRLGIAADVLAEYDRLADRASGVVRAQVVTAVPVDASLRQRIAKELSEKLGGDVQTTVEQDEAIIGGLVVRIGDRVIDSSLRTRLQKLQAALA
jgi:F-type H+-transporting ATPase subunit delta